MNIEIVVRLVALLLEALVTGALMVNWIGLARAMAQMSSAAAYTEFHQATNRTFEPYMPIVVSGSIVSGIALAVVSSGVHSVSGWLAIGGVIGYAIVIAISLSTGVVNNRSKGAILCQLLSWFTAHGMTVLLGTQSSNI